MIPSRFPEWERAMVEELASTAPDFSRIVGRDICCVREIDSTMNLAREAELNGEFGIFVAQSQVAGRGRQGRSWEAAKSGLFVTFVIQGGFSLESLSGLSLVVGLSLREVLHRLGAELFLKWPNDLVTERGEKLGGILIELMSSEATTKILVGVGVNLAGAPETQPGAVDLERLLGKAIPAPELAAKLAIVLWRDWQTFVGSGFSSFQAPWNAAAAYIGRELAIDLGESQVCGVHTGVDSTGRLRLTNGTGEQLVSSGHVLRIGDAARS